ncbi:MAG: hypothetical protein ACYT04_91040, partial [Nostoc sp.]
LKAAGDSKMVILKTSSIVSKHTEMRNFSNALFLKRTESWVLRTGRKLSLIICSMHIRHIS